MFECVFHDSFKKPAEMKMGNIGMERLAQLHGCSSSTYIKIHSKAAIMVAVQPTQETLVTQTASIMATIVHTMVTINVHVWPIGNFVNLDTKYNKGQNRGTLSMCSADTTLESSLPISKFSHFLLEKSMRLETYVKITFLKIPFVFLLTCILS